MLWKGKALTEFKQLFMFFSVYVVLSKVRREKKRHISLLFGMLTHEVTRLEKVMASPVDLNPPMR